MLHFVSQMRDMFRGLTPEIVAEQGNFKLSCILVREMSRRLNITQTLAAEIVGSMTIRVDNDAYHENPELFNETAEAMVGVMVSMRDAYAKEFDFNTATMMTEAAAKQMSLTYG